MPDNKEFKFTTFSKNVVDMFYENFNSHEALDSALKETFKRNDKEYNTENLNKLIKDLSKNPGEKFNPAILEIRVKAVDLLKDFVGQREASKIPTPPKNPELSKKKDPMKSVREGKKSVQVERRKNKLDRFESAELYEGVGDLLTENNKGKLRKFVDNNETLQNMSKSASKKLGSSSLKELANIAKNNLTKLDNAFTREFSELMHSSIKPFVKNKLEVVLLKINSEHVKFSNKKHHKDGINIVVSQGNTVLHDAYNNLISKSVKFAADQKDLKALTTIVNHEAFEKVSPKVMIGLVRDLLGRGKDSAAAHVLEKCSKEDLNKHGSKEVKAFAKMYNQYEKPTYRSQKLEMLNLLHEYKAFSLERKDDLSNVSDLKESFKDHYKSNHKSSHFESKDLDKLVDAAQKFCEHKETPAAKKEVGSAFGKFMESCKWILNSIAEKAHSSFKSVKNVITGNSDKNKVNKVKHDIPDHIQKELKSALKGHKKDDKGFDARDKRSEQAKQHAAEKSKNSRGK